LEDTLALGEHYTSISQQFDKAIVSPYKRTQQTFQQLQKGMGLSISSVTSDKVTPHGDLNDIVELLSEYADLQNVLLVSHQPVVSSLVSLLVTGSTKNAYDYPMIPATVAQLEADDFIAGCFTLKKLFPPPYVS
jgi:phosphohistidine phosphatase